MGSNDQTMKVATQCPPYSVPDNQTGIAHLGVALHLLLRKSHTYQFSLADNCSEGNWGETDEGWGMGSHRKILGA